MKIKKISEKIVDKPSLVEESPKDAKTAAQKSQEANQSELDRLFDKTQTKPQIYYKLLTHEEAMLKKRPPKVLKIEKKTHEATE